VTERLYYTDPYLTEFDAQVLEIVEDPNGRPAAMLDRTAFYPTSGGQPFDTGTIGASRVVDVVDRDDGTILHVLESATQASRNLRAATAARGRVDWNRRFDHMQQHTGQHVLSAAFDRVVGVRTVSFHLGADGATIDLAREVSPTEIERAEEEANLIVWANRPVTIRFADADEAARLPLRKESAREGVLRLIEIADFDLSACGGTHVGSTGEIGIIAVGSTERIRGGSRIEFFCGRRALRSHRRLRDVVLASSKVASVAAAELPTGIERLQGEVKDLKRAEKDLQSRLAQFEADALASRAEPIDSIRFTFAAFEGSDANTLKQIATAVVSRPGFVVIVLSAPPPSFVVVARSTDVTIDAGAVLKRMVERFGGKGGGRPDLAQGGGLAGSTDEMLAHARALAARSVGESSRN
jgi:alanyl-tRNA synthetase